MELTKDIVILRYIVEYFNDKHPDPNRPLDCYKENNGMFRFEKVMK